MTNRTARTSLSSPPVPALAAEPVPEPRRGRYPVPVGL